jgi:hypothetical protein
MDDSGAHRRSRGAHDLVGRHRGDRAGAGCGREHDGEQRGGNAAKQGVHDFPLVIMSTWAERGSGRGPARRRRTPAGGGRMGRMVANRRLPSPRAALIAPQRRPTRAVARNGAATEGAKAVHTNADAEALWPETDPEEGVNRFKFQLHLIRKHLRSDRFPTAKFIELVSDVYRPSPDLFSVDLWEFDRLIGEAIGSKNDSALTAATDLYRGELLQGVYYSWAETLQSHFRSRFLDASVQLSDLHANRGDPEAAVKVLQRAIRVDPYAEHFYRKVMELYARLGRPADIHRTYRELEATLADGHRLRLVIDHEVTNSRGDSLVRPETGPFVVHFDGASRLEVPFHTDFTRSLYRVHP